MIFFFTILLSILICDSYCPTDNMFSYRSLYNIGDMLSEEDQNILFPVCNGSGNYETGDDFSFSDLDGNQNDGDYKITIISMNATW